jgi:hypothetical protein
MPLAPILVPIETSLQVPSMSRSIFSLNSISSPQPRADRQDSLMPLKSNQNLNEKSYKALEQFVPVLPDEITVNVGDTLQILSTFKDGYIYGVNDTAKTKGIFASSCIFSQSPSAMNPRTSEALNSAQSCGQTPIDKLGKPDLEIGSGGKVDQGGYKWKMLIIAGCVLAIVIIAVILFFT